MSDHQFTTEASRQVVTTFYEYLSKGDFEGVLTCFDPEIEIHEPECLPYGGVYKGIDGAISLFTEAPNHLDVRAFQIDAIVADGDKVVGMLRTAVAATGVPVHIAEESTVRDGRIVKVRVFQWDPTLFTRTEAAAR